MAMLGALHAVHFFFNFCAFLDKIKKFINKIHSWAYNSVLNPIHLRVPQPLHNTHTFCSVFCYDQQRGYGLIRCC